MVDKESENYRPRRAFIESGSDPVAGKESASERPAPPDQPPRDPGAGDPVRDFRRWDRCWTTISRSRSIATRSPAASPRPPTGAVSGPDETSVRPITFAPRRTPSFDDERPPSCPGAARPLARHRHGRRFDDFDEDERKPPHPRTRLALLIGAVAAVIVIGLAVGYAVIGIGKSPQANPGPTTTTGGSAPGSTQEPSPGTPAPSSSPTRCC